MISGDDMRLWRKAVLWYLGGMGYVGLELLWRGWSHGSMFLVGGLCFLLIGETERLGLSLWPRALLCGLGITGVELLSGMVLNLGLGLKIWDYSNLPLNILGQVCPVYTLLWQVVSLGAIPADKVLRQLLFGEVPDNPPGVSGKEVQYAGPL